MPVPIAPNARCAPGSNFIATFWCCANIKFYWSLKQTHAFMTIIFLYLYKEGGQLKTSSSTYPPRGVYITGQSKSDIKMSAGMLLIFSSRLALFYVNTQFYNWKLLRLTQGESECKCMEYFSDTSLRGNYYFMLRLSIMKTWVAEKKFLRNLFNMAFIKYNYVAAP